jgi:hypothetical protein
VEAARKARLVNESAFIIAIDPALQINFSLVFLDSTSQTRQHSFENQLPSQLLPFSLLTPKMAATEDPADLFGEDEDDLFGDEDDVQSEQERALSDRELDSGDDEDRNDRAAEHMDDIGQQIGTHDREARILDADFPRQAVPTPTDGEASLDQHASLRGTY